MTNRFHRYHMAHTLFDQNGRPYCEAPFTTKNDTKRYACVLPPDKVIPVIFVPGIMGSNLRQVNSIPEFSSFKGWAWYPDWVAGFCGRFAGFDPAERRLLLDPLNTIVGDTGDIAECGMEPFLLDPPEVQKNWMKEFARRGWGTVMLSSYGAALCHLEYYLNAIYYRGDPSPYWNDVILKRQKAEYTDTHKDGDWGDLKGYRALTEGELKKAADYWYPVHACGYNWTQSNEESGKYLAKKISDITDHYKTLGYSCEKVILLTHSMGGIVARAACAASMGNAEAKVLGIIHGVMPTNGSATAYKRVHAGFEGMTAPVLGSDGPDVAAVFSNSPGALELLPNKQYGSDWLKVVDSKDEVLFSLPKADPYQEIYREPNKWWRLMNPAWINPVRGVQHTTKQQTGLWDRYLTQLDKAESFHDRLSSYGFHPKNYVHYGADSRYATWGTVTWKENGDWMGGDKKRFVENGRIQSTDGLGHMFIQPAQETDRSYEAWDSNGRINTVHRSWRCALEDCREPGDGTVPQDSAKAATPKALFSSAMKGFDHQGSYKNQYVQHLVSYCIARVAQEAS